MKNKKLEGGGEKKKQCHREEFSEQLKKASSHMGVKSRPEVNWSKTGGKCERCQYFLWK